MQGLSRFTGKLCRDIQRGQLNRFSAGVNRYIFKNDNSQGLHTYGSPLLAPVSSRLKIKDVDFHYVTEGSGSQVLVCIPGTLGFALGDYGFLLKNLDKQKFTAVVWDPPGYGKSRPPERDYSGNYFQRDADYLAEFLNTLGYDQYHLLGWSQGGVSAIHMAASFPERVKKLIVFGCFAYVDEIIMSPDRPIARIETWSEDMKKPLIKVYGEDYLYRSWDGWAKSLLRFYEEEGGNMGHKELLNKVQCPTLIIHGDRDPIVPLEHAAFLHERIPNSKLFIWPKGKHNLQLRYPEEFNKIVQEFILKSTVASL